MAQDSQPTKIELNPGRLPIPKAIGHIVQSTHAEDVGRQLETMPGHHHLRRKAFSTKAVYEHKFSEADMKLSRRRYSHESALTTV
jgi:hypothetical protein